MTILGVEDTPTRIWPLPCSAINGIGPKARAKLGNLKTHRIGELAQTDLAWLLEGFGKKYGAWLHEAALGQDNRPRTTCREPKFISRESRFERDLHPKLDREALCKIPLNLCDRLSQDLAHRVGIRLRFEDFSSITRDHALQVGPLTRDDEDVARVGRLGAVRIY